MDLKALALVVTAAIGLSATNAATPRQQLAQFFGQRCATQLGVCFMGQPGVVGQPCWCPTPRGPIPGLIIQ